MERREGKREGGRREGRWKRKFHSLVHSHQITERGTHTISPFQVHLGPLCILVPSPLDSGWQSEWAE